MKLARRIIATGAAAAACAAALVSTTPSLQASGSDTQMKAADEQPGYAVEDFNYPGAEIIKEEKGITLKRGDGHIILADCSSGPGLLEVVSRKNEKICFRTTGTSGYLTLEIPSVHIIKGSAGHTANVTLTTPETKPQEVEVAKGEWTPVGEATDPQGREYVLVEIRTSR
ncbi:hypothetical protein ACH429_15210 [Streptomyces pathocidini]|uniref:Secreted protein n=1 Tax=Streptomyces pathocidini TaxID=1650571 RepID=A0ABW7US46_9ACTN|nr:hypothetical protein [Streptomyces pathocidini]